MHGIPRALPGRPGGARVDRAESFPLIRTAFRGDGTRGLHREVLSGNVSHSSRNEYSGAAAIDRGG